MDLFETNEKYRKFYSFHKNSKNKPTGHINSVSTYLIHVQKRDLELLEKFERGLSPDEFAPYFYFINQNAPMNNLKVIIKFGEELDVGYFFECGDTFVVSIDSKSPAVVSYLAIACLYNTLQDLNKKNTYLAIESVEYKNKRTGKVIPDEVIYISRDKIDKKIYPSFNGTIDWKHSWSVMGHWRSIKTIGKNKKGERVVFGKTWVIPSIKGNGAFVEKIRVVG